MCQRRGFFKSALHTKRIGPLILFIKLGEFGYLLYLFQGFLCNHKARIYDLTLD